MCFTQTQATAATCQMIREFEGELSGVLMERICRQWAEWWQMTSSSFVSPLDCLTSFLGVSLSRAVSSFGLPVYSSIHSRRITNVPKLAITAESYFRRWRKPPEMPEVCWMCTTRAMLHSSQDRIPRGVRSGRGYNTNNILYILQNIGTLVTFTSGRVFCGQREHICFTVLINSEGQGQPHSANENN